MTSPPDELEHVRRRGWRPLGLAAISLLLVLAVVALLVVDLPSNSDSAESTTVANGAPLPASVTGPPGWQSADYGDARLWVPPDWELLAPGTRSCPTGAGVLLLGSAATERCPDGIPPAPTVSLGSLPQPLPPPTNDAQHTMVNGYEVVAPAAQATDVENFIVPALRATIRITGRVPDGVLASLGPSPRHVALADTAPQTPPADWKTVTYHGVRVETPPAWAVVDGNHGGVCGYPFATHPTSFVGPYTIARPHCGTGSPRPLGPGIDGVWLQPAESTPPQQVASVSARDGGAMLLADAPDNDASAILLDLSYHGVSIQIGIGPDPTVARTLLKSIRFVNGAADTGPEGVCPAGSGDRMPPVERLTAPLILGHGVTTLDPPDPTDQPVSTAEDAWRDSGPKQPNETYRIMLARYSATTPARVNQDGSLTPDFQHRLAWIIYATPAKSSRGDCGIFGLSIFDAITGQSLRSGSYSPGP